MLGMPSRRTNNFPESGCGLGHMTPIIFGSTVGYPSDSLASFDNALYKSIHLSTVAFSRQKKYDLRITNGRESHGVIAHEKTHF